MEIRGNFNQPQFVHDTIMYYHNFHDYRARGLYSTKYQALFIFVLNFYVLGLVEEASRNIVAFDTISSYNYGAGGWNACSWETKYL